MSDFTHEKYSSLEKFVAHYHNVFTDVKGWGHAHLDAMDKDRNFVVASYEGYPVMGYLHMSAYSGSDPLCLHRFHDYSGKDAFSSFKGSVADSGDWIKVSALDGLCIIGGMEKAKELYKHFKSMADKKVAEQNGWDVSMRKTFEIDKPTVRYHMDVKIEKDSIKIEDHEYGPETFAADLSFRLSVKSKYEKEFGKIKK